MEQAIPAYNKIELKDFQPNKDNVYCSNTDKKVCPPADNPSLTESADGKCMTLCDYCAKHGENDNRCIYQTNALIMKVKSDFTCSCTQSNIDSPGSRNYEFIPDNRFCGPGSALFCCNLIGGQ